MLRAEIACPGRHAPRLRSDFAHRSFKKESKRMRSFRVVLLSVELLFSAFVLFTSPVPAVASTTPAFVQERNNQVTTGKTSGVTLASPVTAGNLIVAYLIWD